MGSKFMPKEIGRLLTAMVTPFDQHGEVDYTQAKTLAQALLSSGSDGVVIAGTTGESPTLTRQEQTRLFVEVKGSVLDSGSVIAGTGSNSTQEAINYTKDAEESGVDGVLLVVPYYNKPTQEGLYEHFKAIAENTSLPCILYNVPSRTITSLSAETTIRLSEIPNIVGIKEASGDFEKIASITGSAEPGFRVWSGNDADTFHVLCLGGYGVISVASHLVGLQIKTMIQMLVNGNLDGAAKEHIRLLPIFNGIFIVANPIPIKYGVNRVGFEVGHPRLPLTQTDKATSNFLDNLFDQYHMDLSV
jgi:4-hydroxy-tetrahydrodipicolinate synthase